MKKSGITFFIILIIVLSVFAVYSATPETHVEYLRIHVRADSNNESDQRVKYFVKDKVVEFLTPIVSECNTKADAEKTISANLGKIKDVCDAALKEKGFTYTAKASVRKEEFPTRVYEGLTLDSGVYDALIIELGSGQGDNWWCVVYPPLCFTESRVSYIYKSKIKEIIDDFKALHKEKK